MPEAILGLPTVDQELLLKALLFDGEPAIESWNAWRRRISVEEIDLGSQRLLPLLLEKLRRMRVDHPDLRKYQSVARYIWSKNQLLVHVTRQVLVLFDKADIPSMLLKGPAVALLYYDNIGLRATSDLDIIVAPGFAYRAARVLNSNGWHSTWHSETVLQSEGYLRTTSTELFINAQRIEVDLHWHVSPDCCQPLVDDVFWRHSQPVVINGFAARTLGDTEHLFHACIHGSDPKFRGVAPIRWVVDSAQILRSRSIEWDRLLDLGRDFDLVRRLQRTLGYLSRTFALPIPAPVIAELMALQPSRTELSDERVGFWRHHPFLKAAVRRYVHYRRNRASGEGFLHYLQDVYGTRSSVATVLSATKRAAIGLFQ